MNNLLFNTCRESSDHGAFNSWDRLPFVTTVASGTPSTIPAWTDAHHNLIVANYGANAGCLDNDDGSAYYRIHHNVCMYSGHKGDFDGHSKLSYDNLHVHPTVYNPSCLNIGVQALPPAGYADGYFRNRCVLAAASDHYLTINGGLIGGLDCLSGSVAAIDAFAAGLKLMNNTIFVPGGEALVSCGGMPHNPARRTINASAFLKLGYDANTVVIGEMPTVNTILGWASQLLELSNTRFAIDDPRGP